MTLISKYNKGGSQVPVFLLKNVSLSFITKTLIILVLLLRNCGLYCQSFVIGEPSGILDKLITHYKESENVGNNQIIDVEVKQNCDTIIFCIGRFKEASDIFLCLPSAIFKKDTNYIFVKNGSECYFSLDEPYLRFIYDLASKYSRLNINIKDYKPLKIVYTDKIMSVGGSSSSYIWHWYYIVQFKLIKWKKDNSDHYSTCPSGAVPNTPEDWSNK
jgi:hypothetical protein